MIRRASLVTVFAFLLAVAPLLIVAACAGPVPIQNGEIENSELASEDSEPVAILIIDDFKFDLIDPNELNSEDLCGATPDADVAIDDTGAWSPGVGLVMLNDITHGALVHKKFEDLLSSGDLGTGLANIITDTNKLTAPQVLGTGDEITEWNVDGRHLLLVDVDKRGLEIEEIEDKVALVINELVSSGVDKFVINRSYIISPCKHLFELLAYDNNSDGEIDEDDDLNMDGIIDESEINMESYEKFLHCVPIRGGNSTEWIDDYRNARDMEMTRNELSRVQTLLLYGIEPPRRLLNEDDNSETETEQCLREFGLPEEEIARSKGISQRFFERITNAELQTDFDLDLEIIDIAASGNSGNKYPFAHGFYRTTISVGAAASHSEYLPNHAEIIMSDIVTFFVDDVEIPLIGTSFAAPEASLLAAQHLLLGGNVDCVQQFAYAYIDDPSAPDWSNKSLDVAIVDHCSNFVQP